MKTPQELLIDWTLKGKFTYNGITYTKDYKTYESETAGTKILRELMKGQTLTVPLAGYQDYTENRDLNSEYHIGFTLKNGRTMYWYMIWHNSGNCTIANDNASKRWVDGNSEITIHWK